MNTELICICCPLGCPLTPTRDSTGEILITGNSCKKGKDYGQEELTSPRRMLTTTVFVKDGTEPLLSVRTEKAIPKEKLMVCMKILKKVTVIAPVSIGDIIFSNIGNTEVNLIATGNIDRRIT